MSISRFIISEGLQPFLCPCCTSSLERTLRTPPSVCSYRLLQSCLLIPEARLQKTGTLGANMFVGPYELWDWVWDSGGDRFSIYAQNATKLNLKPLF